MSARAADASAARRMDSLVGYILIVGVLASFGLLAAGLAWHWWSTGAARLDYDLTGMTVFQFVVSDVRQLAAGAWRPRSFVNLGLAVLLLTPYARVVASVLYFALVERNAKYTVFTAFVLATLTYSLFLR